MEGVIRRARVARYGPAYRKRKKAEPAAGWVQMLFLQLCFCLVIIVITAFLKWINLSPTNSFLHTIKISITTDADLNSFYKSVDSFIEWAAGFFGNDEANNKSPDVFEPSGNSFEKGTDETRMGASGAASAESDNQVQRSEGAGRIDSQSGQNQPASASPSSHSVTGGSVIRLVPAVLPNSVNWSGDSSVGRNQGLTGTSSGGQSNGAAAGSGASADNTANSQTLGGTAEPAFSVEPSGATSPGGAQALPAQQADAGHSATQAFETAKIEKPAQKVKSQYTFQFPVDGIISSGYGSRIHPVTKEQEFHKGIDIDAPKGSPIRAALDGEVIETGEDQTFGKYVKVQTGDNIQTFYAHCSQILVSKGQKVKKGAMIAKVGDSGLATDTHLHFEVYVDGKAEDPIFFYER